MMIKQLDEFNLFLSSSSNTRWRLTSATISCSPNSFRAGWQRTYPESLPGLYSRIAGWYQQEGQLVKAISFYFLAGEKAHAVYLVDQVSRELYLSGQARSLEEWYSEIAGEPDLVSPPRICC